MQTIIPLPGHGAMRLTTARYYTPSGRSIQAVGIEPDIYVPQARVETVDERRRREADLRGALDNGAPDAAAPPPGGEAAETDRAQQDYLRARALDLLRGIALYSERLGAPEG